MNSYDSTTPTFQSLKQAEAKRRSWLTELCLIPHEVRMTCPGITAPSTAKQLQFLPSAVDIRLSGFWFARPAAPYQRASLVVQASRQTFASTHTVTWILSIPRLLSKATKDAVGPTYPFSPDQPPKTCAQEIASSPSRLPFCTIVSRHRIHAASCIVGCGGLC